jgi:peptidoglycan hydrolase-like protein with peptidoglycan-binding domain
MAKLKPPERIRLGDKGAQVKALQKAVNARHRGDAKRGLTNLKVDGDAGRETIAVARKAAKSLGADVSGEGVGPRAQQVIRQPWVRDKAELAREKKWMAAREKERAAAAKQAKQHPNVSGNTVSGGTPRARAVAAGMEAARLYYTGKSNRFYSQPGAWTVSLGITGEVRGQRSDCSQFVTSMSKSAGLPDPNGRDYKDGWTGTLQAHLREIKRTQLQPGDLVIYFRGAGSYHVEQWVGNGDGKTPYAALAKAGSTYRDRTVGHGSAPVDYGDIDMASGARFFALDLN